MSRFAAPISPPSENNIENLSLEDPFLEALEQDRSLRRALSEEAIQRWIETHKPLSTKTSPAISEELKQDPIS